MTTEIEIASLKRRLSLNYIFVTFSELLCNGTPQKEPHSATKHSLGPLLGQRFFNVSLHRNLRKQKASSTFDGIYNSYIEPNLKINVRSLPPVTDHFRRRTISVHDHFGHKHFGTVIQKVISI